MLRIDKNFQLSFSLDGKLVNKKFNIYTKHVIVLMEINGEDPWHESTPKYISPPLPK